MKPGWAPTRKRKKRLAKKLRRNAARHYGYREKPVIRLNAEQSEEFVRQLLER